jgi:hypothetical protein
MEHDDWPDTDSQWISIGDIFIPVSSDPNFFLMAAKAWIDCYLSRESRLSPRKLFHVSFIANIVDIDSIQEHIEAGMITKYKLIDRVIDRVYLKWTSPDDREVKLHFRKLSDEEIKEAETEGF